MGNFFSNVTFTDMSCLTPPAIRMELVEDDGRVGVDRLVTESIVVNSINRIIGDLTILVSAQSTTTSIEIMVRDNL